MLVDLRRSDLDADDAKRLRLEPLNAAATRAATDGKYSVDSYRIPYFDPDGRPTDFWRLRFLGDVRSFGAKKPQRYWQPGNTLPHAYLVPGVPWSKFLDDAGALATITEGEKKAAAATKAGLITIALGGVWNFKSEKAGVELISELENIECDGRLIEIAYDGDALVNENVRHARKSLGSLLVARGAEVVLVHLPLGMALDNFLPKEGLDAYRRLPREPFDAKVQISFVRGRKASAHEKKERISGIALRDLQAKGGLHIIDGNEPMYFRRDERRLISLLSDDNPELRAFASDLYGINAATDEYKFVYEHVRAHALRHGSPGAARFLSHYDKGTLWLHAGAQAVYRVTPKGVSQISNGDDGVLFRAYDAEAVVPSRRPSASAFHDVVGLPNFRGGQELTVKQQRALYELHFWSLLFPSLMPTRPLLLLEGPKGSTKTTAARSTGTALLGPRFNVHPVDRERLNDTVAAFVADPLVVLDNLDGKMSGLENLLAIASTGGNVPRRILFTTMDKIEYPLRARIIATSRQPDVFVRDDVRDRTIILRMERLTNFRAEGDILSRVIESRPGFWAYVLSRLPDILKALHRHKPKPLPHRLADFAQFAVAIGPAVGLRTNDVLEALSALEMERNAFASERSAILQALQYWIDDITASGFKPGCVEMPTGTLFDLVRKSWPHGQFPFHRPESFGRMLRNEELMLKAYFKITRRKGHANQTLITIKPIGEDDER